LGGGEREDLEEEKPTRGASVAAGNTIVMATDSCNEQSPEGGTGRAGVWPCKRLDRRDRRNRREGSGQRRAGTAVREGKPLKGKTLDAAAG